MSRALIVFCHPSPESYSAAIGKAVEQAVTAHGWDFDVIDLYREGFDPVLSRAEWEGIEQVPENRQLVERHVALMEAADALIIIYPTWWYGLPAILKGWLDRVLIPGSAFFIPETGDIRPGLTNIRRIGVFTTCGASRWLTFFVGAPGKRTLLRGVRLLCHPRARTVFAAHYNMDRSTAESRKRHLDKIPTLVAKLLSGGRPNRAGKDLAQDPDAAVDVTKNPARNPARNTAKNAA